MTSSHPILCRPLLLLPPVPPSIRVFCNESTLRMRWPKYWSFSFSIIPSKEHRGLISFRMDWLDLLGVQGTLCLPLLKIFYFYKILKGCFPLTVIMKYWLFSPYCIPPMYSHILEPVLYPVVCTFYSPTLMLPILSPLMTTRLFSVSVSLFLFWYIHQFVVFCTFHISMISYRIYLSLSGLFHLV